MITLALSACVFDLSGSGTDAVCKNPLALYYDADGDGFGDTRLEQAQCAASPGFVEAGGDCDDLDPLVVAVPEICDNGLDDDCGAGGAGDGLVDCEDPDCDKFCDGGPTDSGPGTTDTGGDSALRAEPQDAMTVAFPYTEFFQILVHNDRNYDVRILTSEVDEGDDGDLGIWTYYSPLLPTPTTIYANSSTFLYVGCAPLVDTPIGATDDLRVSGTTDDPVQAGFRFILTCTVE